MTAQYWFMLPVAVGIATIATGSGVGGASFFAPLFMLVLGIPPEVAVAAALVTEVFGFASGGIAYARQRLIDYRLGRMLLLATIPMALLGVWLAGLFEPTVLKAILGVALFAVGASALRAPTQEHKALLDAAILRDFGESGETTLVTADGTTLRYTVCNRMEGMLIAALGALFKGLIATGLGELNDDFLLERCRVPCRVSVATNVYVVLFTTLAASLGHVTRFAMQSGHELAAIASLLAFTVPGVIVGGQLGPRLARRFPERTYTRVLHVFLLLVAAFTFAEAILELARRGV